MDMRSGMMMGVVVGGLLLLLLQSARSVDRNRAEVLDRVGRSKFVQRVWFGGDDGL